MYFWYMKYTKNIYVMLPWDIFAMRSACQISERYNFFDTLMCFVWSIENSSKLDDMI